MRNVRCAIYTRKSSEEGLEQDFNSLHAQREACNAYVLSQASEGWTAVPDQYDDGGLSGGSLERPALQRLLADIALGKVDIVVVYKVDRLTRSLLDFSKLVEAFDKAGVSFVSITQSFNTTTSMGRLTLNMLLSFAQFEREVTAERIRDKLAASKAKGMWMGGVSPLGYEPDGRTLKIVPEHAVIIRHIYERYLALGNVGLLVEELARENRRLPLRITRTGKSMGGGLFCKGQIYAILKSPIYAGDIPHKGKTFPGLHEPIIDRDTWDAVQARLAGQVQGSRRGPRTANASPLAGKVVDDHGNKLTSSHACKHVLSKAEGGTRRYRYYVGQAESGSTDNTIRIPAQELERAVAQCIASALDDPVDLCASAGMPIQPDTLSSLAGRAGLLAAKLRDGGAQDLRALVSQVRVLAESIRIDCDIGALFAMLLPDTGIDSGRTFPLIADVRLKRSGRAMRLVQDDGRIATSTPARSLIKLVVKARRWWITLRAGDIDVTTLAAREGVTPSYMTRVVRLAFLAPNVVEAILAGEVRAEVDGVMLTCRDAIAPGWRDQRLKMLPASASIAERVTVTAMV